jgi:hypothetical protein
MSFPPGTEMFQFPGFACYSLCIQEHIPPCDNGSPKPFVFRHPVRASPDPSFKGLCAFKHGLGIPLSKVGFPIRKSTDQSFFAAPRGLSQRSTSFIASQRQGIHQMPLVHLIALIINAHSAGPDSLVAVILAASR